MNKAAVEQLRDLPNTSYGDALRIYLEEEITKLRDISSIDCPVDEVAIQVTARKEAVKILKNVMALATPKPKPIQRSQYR